MLDNGMTPEMILEHILGDLGLEILDTIPTQFECNCSRERVEKALISIGKEDLDEMIADDKPTEVNCHFCNTNYSFSVEDLKQLLLSRKI
jgi:molecular chaperone Hsp33